jgi:hypothetical protein
VIRPEPGGPLETMEAAIMSGSQEVTEIVNCAVHWMDIQIIGDVVAVIFER